jgi:molybdopterin synthase catalytic subunit
MVLRIRPKYCALYREIVGSSEIEKVEEKGGGNMIRIQTEDFDVQSALNDLDKGVGAVVNFIGVVRAEPDLKGIDFEVYEDMAMEKLKGLDEEAKRKFGVKDVHIIHRIGMLKPGENIVHISVSSAHRKEAFQACEWLIDELKKIVPIWKKDAL